MAKRAVDPLSAARDSVAHNALARRDFFKLSLGVGAAVTVVQGSPGFAQAQSTVDPRFGLNLVTYPPPNPKLPQDCTPHELELRMKFLDSERHIYRWSLNVENVEGIPMLENLPVGENPSVDWLIEFIDNFIDLLANLVATAVEKVIPESQPVTRTIATSLVSIKELLLVEVEKYTVLVKKYDSLPVNVVVDTADRAAIDLVGRTLMGIVSQLQTLRKDLFATIESELKRQHRWIGEIGQRGGLAEYDQMWGTIPIPKVAQEVDSDEFFGYARVAGPNPVLIEKLTRLPSELSLDGDRFSRSAGETFEDAYADGRVFILNYAALGSMAKEDATFKLLTGDGYNTAPIALFVLPRGGSVMRPVLIQIGQESGSSPVFYAPAPGDDDTSAYWGWRMAKTVVQTADFNYHEMFSHLAHTHLVSEGFCVAMHRTIPRGHPLRELLEPHFEGALFINAVAASIIMGPYTFGDIILAPAMADIATEVGTKRGEWNFTEKMPPRDFQARGVDDPRLEYPYRDDALLIWNEILGWVGDYLAVYYVDDEAVRLDTDLDAWVNEVQREAKISGFDRPQTRADLVQSISMVIFTASAQHAAVNYLQRDEMTYSAYYSGTLKSLPDKPDGTYTEDDWVNMLPTFLSASAQMYFLNVLGTVYYRRLGEYKLPYFPHRPALTDTRVADPLEKFNSRLRAVEEEIVRRNAGRKWEYPYLLPSNIPTSTNI